MWFFLFLQSESFSMDKRELLKKQAIGMEKFSAKEVYDDLHEEYDHPSDS